MLGITVQSELTPLEMNLRLQSSALFPLGYTYMSQEPSEREGSCPPGTIRESDSDTTSSTSTQGKQKAFTPPQ